jgi:hypothetical protein
MLLFLSAVLACCGGAYAQPVPNSRAAGKQCFQESTPIRVTGTVNKQTFLGPPNFGETPKTDHRVTVYVFHFDQPQLPCELSEFDNIDHEPGTPAREAVIVALDHRKPDVGRQTLVGQLEHSDNANQFLDYIFVIPHEPR